MLRALLALLFVAVATTAQAQAQVERLELIGPERRVTLSAAEVATLPRHRVSLAAHGPARTYEGPLLIDLMARVGAPTGQALRGPALADVVIATASDGYVVAIGLAEADPSTRANRIIVADRVDGAPLDSDSGPFRLVVEGDLRTARSARRVTRLEWRSLR